MKTNILRTLAVTLGIGVCTIAQGQSTYTSPAHWNNFRPVSEKKVAKKVASEAIPAPAAQLPASAPQPIPMSTSPYQQAASSSWCTSERAPLSPYFGSAKLLFLTLEEGWGSPVATYPGGTISTSIVDPEDVVGFDIGVGRYMDCGRYAVGINYFLWNPSEESEIRNGGAGTMRPTNPGYNNIEMAPGGPGNSAYDLVDLNATGIRVSRDLRFQGIEANLFHFGLMGARRASYAGCNAGSCQAGRISRKLGIGKCGHGFGGAAGPMVRGNGGRMRVMMSHGFRWFQIEDELEYAYNIDGGGYGPSDLYENTDVENNLFGYQLGSQLNYCINSRMNLNIGGKFGIYGNRAELRHRVGDDNGNTAYRTGVPADAIDTVDSDTVLATLGELDLGLGYRINCAWTVRGGYRLIGVTGVANAADSVPRDYSSVAASGRIYADDSYILHGGYVGLEFNW